MSEVPPATDRLATEDDEETPHLPADPQPTVPNDHPVVKRITSVLIAAVSALILVATGVYWNIQVSGEAGITANQVDAGLGNAPPTVAPTGTRTQDQPQPNPAPAPPAPSPTYQPENFLLLGSDVRDGNPIPGTDDGSLGGTANSDTIMVLHVSGDRKRVSVLSIPRDLWAPAAQCQTYDATTRQYGAMFETTDALWHMNNFYSVGGPKCAVKGVEQLTGIDINRYIEIGFNGFKSMVDALGGVTINACGPIVDAELQTLVETGGVQRITGTQALHLARARNVEGDQASDISRIHRQQLLLSAILRQVKSSDTLLDPNKLSAFVTAFTQNTITNGVNFENLMNLAESLGNLDPAEVTFYTLPTVPDEQDTSGRGSMYVDRANANPLFTSIINDQPVPGTDPTPTPAASTAGSPPPQSNQAATDTITVAPAEVNLTVVNATATSGLGGVAADALNSVGFQIAQNRLVRAQDSSQDNVMVQYSAGNEAAALTVASALPGAELVAVAGLDSQVMLLLGASYDNGPAANQVRFVQVGDVIPVGLLSQIPAGSAGNVVASSTDASVSGTATAVSEIPQVNASTSDCL